MAAAINHNDIMEIVKSNTSSMKVILDSVGSFVKACANIKKINTKSAEKVLKGIKSLIPLISDIIFSMRINKNVVVEQINTQQSISNIMVKYLELFEKISTLKIPNDFLIKLLVIKKYAKISSKYIQDILSNINIIKADFLKDISVKIGSIAKELNNIYVIINGLKINKLLGFKLGLIKWHLFLLNDFIIYLNIYSLTSLPLLILLSNHMILIFGKMSLVLFFVGLIFNIIRGIEISLLFNAKLNFIKKGLSKIFDLFENIHIYLVKHFKYLN